MLDRMQIEPTNNGTGVVQWVVPPPTRSMRDRGRQLSGGNNKSWRTPDSSHSNESRMDNRDYISCAPSKQIDSSIWVQASTDIATCKTLCTFAQYHLKELQEHQRLIARTRANLLSTHAHNQQDALSMSRYDTSKLKVRGQQIKAIETIKQLTNYLKELTHLKRHFESEATNGPMHDEALNKVSDIRAEIIQALNNFVLENSDIDFPIDSEEFDYDLCIDARVRDQNYLDPSGQHQSKIETSISSKKVSQEEDAPHSLLGSSEDTSQFQQVLAAQSQDQKGNLERYRREIQKLERDTMELRRLFSDFYVLVKTQEEQIDSIEGNIMVAHHHIYEGQHNLSRTMKSLTILVPVTGCMAGALIGGPIGVAVGGKLGGLTVGCVTSLLGLVSTYGAQRLIACNKLKDS